MKDEILSTQLIYLSHELLAFDTIFSREDVCQLQMLKPQKARLTYSRVLSGD